MFITITGTTHKAMGSHRLPSERKQLIAFKDFSPPSMDLSRSQGCFQGNYKVWHLFGFVPKKSWACSYCDPRFPQFGRRRLMDSPPLLLCLAPWRAACPRCPTAERWHGMARHGMARLLLHWQGFEDLSHCTPAQKHPKFGILRKVYWEVYGKVRLSTDDI